MFLLLHFHGFSLQVLILLAKVKPEPGAFEKAIWHKNYTRLLIWCCIGADVENGNWAIYGARLGCQLTNLDPNFDIHNIRDYEWFKNYFNTEIEPNITEENINEKIIETGNVLRSDIGMQIGEITANASKFFKRVYINPSRVEELVIRN